MNKEDSIALAGLAGLSIIAGLISCVGINYGLFWAVGLFIGVFIPLAVLIEMGMRHCEPKSPQRKLTEWIKDE